MLALNLGDIALGGVCKISCHNYHLRVCDDIATQQAMRRSRARIIGIPLDPLKSRHREHIDVIESLEVIHNADNKQSRMGLTVSFSPKPNPP